MQAKIIVPVILAGGFGERLWPISRTTYPKQFIKILDSDLSLFQITVQRLTGLDNFIDPIVICHEEHRFIAAEQLRVIEAKCSAFFLEPQSNNTAPAIALAALWAEQQEEMQDKEIILAVFPADHYITDKVAFSNCVHDAAELAQQDLFVTFGIKPTKPETGYGYICANGRISNPNIKADAFEIAKFTEKPDLDTAKQFITDSNYYWNSGMFVFKASVFNQALHTMQPEIYNHVHNSLQNISLDLDFIRPDKDAYANCPADSIDYAIMEKVDKAAMVVLSSSWSDIGSWSSVLEQAAKDENQNYISGDVVTQETKNCMIDARSRLVATVNVSNLSIVETPDAVLVADLDSGQKIKDIVNTLRSKNHPTTNEHRQVVRPWGWYDSLAKGNRFQVKHIFVLPGKSLSLQLHHHRSEHWIIVYGSAKVVRGEETFNLSENESTFIPIGTKHQLTNIGKIPLELIEVQSGSYLGEDDIVRFKDEHGRITVDENNYV